MNPYEESIKIWISRNHHGKKVCWAEDIVSFEFDSDGSGCETCWIEEIVIRYTVKRNGKTTHHCVSLDGKSPADFVAECMEIYKTISYIKPYEFMEKY